MNNDPIGDMLTRIRNASMVRAPSVEMAHSNICCAITRIMKREGFIRDFTTEGKGSARRLRIYLKYDSDKEKTPVFRGLRRVSKPGLRRYISPKKLRPVFRGTGVAVLSTSRGVITDQEARKLNVGGEWLCTIW